MLKKLWLIVVVVVCVLTIGLAVPIEANHCSPYALGDLNNIPTISGADIVLELLYVFQGTPPPAIPPAMQLCVADMNCDGQLTPVDVVILLNNIGGTPDC